MRILFIFLLGVLIASCDTKEASVNTETIPLVDLLPKTEKAVGVPLLDERKLAIFKGELEGEPVENRLPCVHDLYITINSYDKTFNGQNFVFLQTKDHDQEMHSMVRWVIDPDDYNTGQTYLLQITATNQPTPKFCIEDDNVAAHTMNEGFEIDFDLCLFDGVTQPVCTTMVFQPNQIEHYQVLN